VLFTDKQIAKACHPAMDYHNRFNYNKAAAYNEASPFHYLEQNSTPSPFTWSSIQVLLLTLAINSQSVSAAAVSVTASSQQTLFAAGNGLEFGIIED
jgi:hypothetical protein